MAVWSGGTHSDLDDGYCLAPLGGNGSQFYAARRDDFEVGQRMLIEFGVSDSLDQVMYFLNKLRLFHHFVYHYKPLSFVILR